MTDFVTHSEGTLIARIVDRALRLPKKPATPPLDRITLTSELALVHRIICRLDLARLAASPDRTFFHDVFGIRDNLDHDTHELRGFVPRCAADRRHDEPDAELMAAEAANMDGTSEPGLHDIAGRPPGAGEGGSTPPTLKLYVVLDATGAAISGPNAVREVAEFHMTHQTAARPCALVSFVVPITRETPSWEGA